MAAAEGRVLLDLSGVSVPLSLPPPRLLRGRLRVTDGPQDLVLHWEPLEPPGDVDPPDPGFEPDWAVLSPPRAPPEPGWSGGFGVPLGSLWGLRRGPPGLGRALLLLLPRPGEGPGPPPLLLRRGALRRLLRLLGPRLRACPRDPRLLLLTTPEDPPEPPPEPGLVTRLLQGGLGRLLGAGPRGGRGQGAEPEPEAEPPFEVIACVSLGPRPFPPRGPPVTREEWGRGHDAEGRSLNPEMLRERIFRGGLNPEVRPQAWPRLLKLRPWAEPETPLERERRDDYFRMKLQWRSLSPGQLRRNSVLRGYRDRLERDLQRGPPLAPPALFRNVLLTFCAFNFDLGYRKGMLEVLTPLISVTPDEVEAFWGFCQIMEMVGENFGPGREGLEQQLGELGALVRVVNPNISPLLDRAGPRGICSQWLQFRFQRELGMEGTRRMMEVLWTGLPCPNFLLLVTCALLELLGDISGDIGDVIGDIGDIGGGISDVSGDISDVIGDVRDVGGGIGDVRGDIGDVGDITGGIGDVTSGISDTIGGIGDVGGGIGDVIGGVSDVTGDIGGAFGDIGDVIGADSDSDSDGDGDKFSPALDVGSVLSRAEGIFLQLKAATDLPPALQELLGLGGPPPEPPPPPE